MKHIKKVANSIQLKNEKKKHLEYLGKFKG